MVGPIEGYNRARRVSVSGASNPVRGESDLAVQTFHVSCARRTLRKVSGKGP
jgi:hypothetical protein